MRALRIPRGEIRVEWQQNYCEWEEEFDSDRERGAVRLFVLR